MKNIPIHYFVIASLFSLSAQPGYAQELLPTEKSKQSYALAYQLFSDPLYQDMPLKEEYVLLGAQNTIQNKDSILSSQESELAQENIERLVEQFRLKIAQQNRLEGDQFLKANRLKQGVNTTPTGLQYRVIKRAEGPSAKPEQNALISYSATLVDGSPVDFSFGIPHPIEVSLDGGLIEGLTEGILLMTKDSIYQFFIPSHIGYGDDGNAAVPPGATLIVTVTLNQLLKAPE